MATKKPVCTAFRATTPTRMERISMTPVERGSVRARGAICAHARRHACLHSLIHAVSAVCQASCRVWGRTGDHTGPARSFPEDWRT